MEEKKEIESEIKSSDQSLIDQYEKKGFDQFFDFVPANSWYLAVVVCFGLWLEMPSGAIQLASNILQANPGNSIGYPFLYRNRARYREEPEVG